MPGESESAKRKDEHAMATIDDLAGGGVDFDQAFGVTFGRYRNLNVYCPFCEDPEHSTSKSCSITRDGGGVFSCKSCGARGTAVEFFVHRTGHSATVLASAKKTKPKTVEQIAPVLNADIVVRCHQQLLRSTIQLRYLMHARGLSMATIKEYQLGCDETRITIPVRDAEGALIGMRRYLPHAKTAPKMVAHEGGDGGAHLWPAEKWPSAEAAGGGGELILHEGEWDTLLSRQNGFDAFTVTSGVQTWDHRFTTAIQETGRDVVVMYDVHDKPNKQGVGDLGQRTATGRADILMAHGVRVKVVALPLPESYVGGDVTNWYVDERRTAEELRALIDATPWHSPTPLVDNGTVREGAEVTTGGEGDVVTTLYDASKASYFYKPIRLRCLVAGRGASPYLVPAKVRAHYKLSADDEGTVERTFDGNDGDILAMINCSTSRQKTLLGKLLNVPEEADSFTIEVVESMNVEEIYLIPSIDHSVDQGPYVMRTAYYVGHGIDTNTVYDFEGYTLPDPRTQAATHILTKAVRASTNVDACVLDEAETEELRRVFHAEDVHEKLEHIADELAHHVTRIYGRNDLHTAVDLVFHSPLSFDFGGVRLRKGWLECLILGDTRTGKGYVTEGLSGHYGVGEIVSGENLTFAGLVGGIQRVGERWILVWGKIPLNDRRLLVMDECSSLSINDIGKLSRIRSEGVAEVTKIISEKTSSRTRLVWLSNARATGVGERARVMSDYNHGIEAVPELMGTAEDVARFDYVLIVAQNEVPSDVINEAHRPSAPLTYSSDLCRKLVVWVWSRKPEHIIFDKGVVEYAYKAAKDLGRHFTPKVCLIQSEDVRYKLVRIAAAAAGRTFSSPDGVHLVVTKEHVEFAYNFLFHIYSKPSSGYAQLSAAEREQATLRDPEGTKRILEQAGPLFGDLVDGLLEHRQITQREISDYAGLDQYQARGIISELVRMRALIKEYGWYVKRPAFRSFLQDLKMSLSEGPHSTTLEESEDDDIDTADHAGHELRTNSDADDERRNGGDCEQEAGEALPTG